MYNYPYSDLDFDSRVIQDALTLPYKDPSYRPSPPVSIEDTVRDKLRERENIARIVRHELETLYAEKPNFLRANPMSGLDNKPWQAQGQSQGLNQAPRAITQRPPYTLDTARGLWSNPIANYQRELAANPEHGQGRNREHFVARPIKPQDCAACDEGFCATCNKSESAGGVVEGLAIYWNKNQKRILLLLVFVLVIVCVVQMYNQHEIVLELHALRAMFAQANPAAQAAPQGQATPPNPNAQATQANPAPIVDIDPKSG